MEFKPTYAIVNNENCDLHYWYQGSGPLITFVPGGNGHGRQYNAIMAALSDKYTCVTFDRRQMSASQVKVNKILKLPQQARDVVAVIKAMGFSKSIVFGSSLGGIIGFQLALDFPEIIDHVICHEAPTVSLLPNSSAIMDWLMGIKDLWNETRDLKACQAEFESGFKGFGEPGVPQTNPPEPENPINFWDNEFYGASFYVPDMRRIIANKVSIGLMTGARSRDAFYALTTYEQEKILGCLRMTVPGHHQGYEAELEAFLPAMVEMLAELEKRRGANT